MSKISIGRTETISIEGHKIILKFAQESDPSVIKRVKTALIQTGLSQAKKSENLRKIS